MKRRAPANVEAERRLLGAVLIKPALLGRLVEAGVSDATFFRGQHAWVWRAMVECEGRGISLDAVTVAEMLAKSDITEGVPELLADLVACCPTTEPVAEWARLLRDKERRRAVILACADVSGAAMADGADAEAVIDAAEARVFALARTERAGASVLATALPPVVDAAMARRDVGAAANGLPTGFADLDALLGGLRPGELVIIAARPGMGKTALALNIARNCGVPALFLSLEMTREALIERLLCAEAGVDGIRLRTGRCSGAEWVRLMDAAAALVSVPIWTDDAAVYSLLELRASARRWALAHARAGGLVAVDYLQLVHGSDRRRDRREGEVSEVARGLKALARELSMPVIALAQLNRECERRDDKRPRLADLRESGETEQAADAVLMLYREDCYSHGREGVAEVLVEKQRSGPTGVVRLAWSPGPTRFDSLSGRVADGAEART